MKAETLKKRLEERYKEPHNTIGYRIIKDLINGTHKVVMDGNIIRPAYYHGYGPYTCIIDHSDQIKHILDLLEVKYEVGNDAPRGGKPGDYIRILTKIEKS